MWRNREPLTREHACANKAVEDTLASSRSSPLTFAPPGTAAQTAMLSELQRLACCAADRRLANKSLEQKTRARVRAKLGPVHVFLLNIAVGPGERMKLKAGIYLAVALITPMLYCGCGKSPSTVLPPPSEPTQPTVSELRGRVDKLLATHDTVMVRRGIADVFVLIDLLLAEGQQEDAMRYLSAALKHNAWALEYQMRYAELAGQKGEPDVAGQKANLVSEHAEQDDLLVRARAILGQPPLPSFSPIQAIPDDTTTLVLVPVGDVDRCVLNGLSKDLGDVLHIPVIVRDAEVSIPEYARDPVSRHLATVRTNLINGMKQDIRLASFLKQKGLSESALQDDDSVVTACRHLSLQSGGTNALSQFDAGLRELRQAPKQWDIDGLLRALRTAVRPFVKRNTYFIGVANLDAFADQSNYIFGTAENNGHHAVITYRRFTAAFNRENPNRKRLLDRTLKQSLSSFVSFR